MNDAGKTRCCAAIALGSNLGDRAATIHSACERLAFHPDISVRSISRLIETDPVTMPGSALQGRYLNGAALLDTALSPHHLMKALLEIERALGRVRHTRWEARAIDLDLLLYEDAVINDPPALIVPHPAMHERRFVLQPLAEIAPDMIHPTRQRTVRQMLAELRRQHRDAAAPDTG